MKKLTLLLLLTVIAASFGNAALAQKNGGQRSDDPFDMKDFIEKKNAYLTEKLSLTAEVAKKFLPLDNELMVKKFEVGRECHRLGRELHDKKNRSEEEYAKLLKCREEVKAKRFELEKEYMDKFKDILSAEQIIIYERAAKDFLDDYMKNKR